MSALLSFRIYFSGYPVSYGFSGRSTLKAFPATKGMRSSGPCKWDQMTRQALATVSFKHSRPRLHSCLGGHFKTGTHG
jgi:hypothetical protein